MILIDEQNVNAVLLNEDFIKKAINTDKDVYNQILSNLKLSFLDTFPIDKLDNIPLGDGVLS